MFCESIVVDSFGDYEAPKVILMYMLTQIIRVMCHYSTVKSILWSPHALKLVFLVHITARVEVIA